MHLGRDARAGVDTVVRVEVTKDDHELVCTHSKSRSSRYAIAPTAEPQERAEMQDEPGVARMRLPARYSITAWRLPAASCKARLLGVLT